MAYHFLISKGSVDQKESKVIQTELGSYATHEEAEIAGKNELAKIVQLDNLVWQLKDLYTDHSVKYGIDSTGRVVIILNPTTQRIL